MASRRWCILDLDHRHVQSKAESGRGHLAIRNIFWPALSPLLAQWHPTGLGARQTDTPQPKRPVTPDSYLSPKPFLMEEYVCENCLQCSFFYSFSHSHLHPIWMRSTKSSVTTSQRQDTAPRGTGTVLVCPTSQHLLYT